MNTFVVHCRHTCIIYVCICHTYIDIDYLLDSDVCYVTAVYNYVAFALGPSMSWERDLNTALFVILIYGIFRTN